MSTHRTTRRAASALGVVALLTPAVLALSAGPAWAEGSFTSPTPDNGSTVSSSFSVKATTTRKGTTVSLSGPGFTTVSKSSSTAVTASSTQTVSLDAVDPAQYPNGTWTAKISSGETRSFSSAFGAATPTGFDAQGSGAHDVLLTWDAGSEPDLIGYKLFDGRGNVLNDSIAAGSACSGGACSYSLYYDNPDPGTYNYGYALSALRNGGCGNSSCPLESGKTDPRYASLKTPVPPPPSPSPKPSPTAGPSSSPGTGGTGTGGTGGTGTGSTGGTSGGSSTGDGAGAGGGSNASTGGTTSASPVALPTLDPVAIQKRAFALNFGNFSASLGIPKLPPLPNAVPQLPASEALPQGTFNPTLPYSDATETTKTTSFVRSPIGSISSMDPQKLWPMIAMSLILVMTAAHLRRWVGAHVED